MLMRVSCDIRTGDVAAALETYDLTSRRAFPHAAPTLFNAGTPTSQRSGRFLMRFQEDSVEGIYQTLTQCAMISKSAGESSSPFQKAVLKLPTAVAPMAPATVWYR